MYIILYKFLISRHNKMGQLVSMRPKNRFAFQIIFIINAIQLTKLNSFSNSKSKCKFWHFNYNLEKEDRFFWDCRQPRRYQITNKIFYTIIIMKFLLKRTWEWSKMRRMVQWRMLLGVLFEGSKCLDLGCERRWRLWMQFCFEYAQPRCQTCGLASI